jgi:hypothetical protein
MRAKAKLSASALPTKRLTTTVAPTTASRMKGQLCVRLITNAPQQQTARWPETGDALRLDQQADTDPGTAEIGQADQHRPREQPQGCTRARRHHRSTQEPSNWITRRSVDWELTDHMTTSTFVASPL